MKCRACDSPLTDFEATRKRADNEEYLDLCNLCFDPLRSLIEVIERFDLYEGEFDIDLTDGAGSAIPDKGIGPDNDE